APMNAVTRAIETSTSLPGSSLGTHIPEALPRCLQSVLPHLSLVLALLAYSAVSAADTVPPGLVKEQPSSGRFVKTEQGYMVPYGQTIPGTDVTFEMQPIPGGKFLLVSPASEQGHKADEGPQVEVEIEPFWMS